MKQILNRLLEHKTLSYEEARSVLLDIAQGKYNNSQIASFLTIFMMRSITVDELSGFRDALLELCLKIDLNEFNPIDLCGTGGDAKDTFNISTLASFVVAGAKINVAKHGNYGVSSVCGSSNVLEYLGLKFTNKNNILKKQMYKAGICFMHAPLFHPAMKMVASVRKELGVKTFFNMLGPLVNPAFPKMQLIGVFNLELARLYAYLYQNTKKKFIIFHNLDGYDEISLTAPFKMISETGENIITPESMGFKENNPDELYGGKSIKEAAKIFVSVLEGKGTRAHENTVIANAAMAITCATGKNISECIETATYSLKNKNAMGSFKNLIETQS